MAKIDAVTVAPREVCRVRAGALRNLEGGLRTLYRTFEWPRLRPPARPWLKQSREPGERMAKLKQPAAK